MLFIQNHSPVFYLTAFFFAGVLLAFTPCVLPMVPILSSIITGHDAHSRRQSFKLSLGYVLGMAVTYALVGMLAALFGSTVQTLMQQPLIIACFSMLFTLMALWLLGVFELRMPAFMQFKPSKRGRGGVLSAALMGSLSTLVVSPCVTAPLIGILTYVAQTNNVFQGGLLLFVLALGMGLPLLIVGAGFSRFLPSSGPWMVYIKQLFAIMMLAMAVWLLSRVMPQYWINWLWTLVLLVSASIFGAFRGARVLQVVAVFALMGAGALAYQNVSATADKIPQAPFIVVHSLEEVNTQLAQASAANKRVFIEFYANWCGDCQAMDKYVFNQQAVIDAMQESVNLRVDISEKAQSIAEVRQAFHIYGIPTLLFYNEQGQKLANLDSVGQIPKEKMLELFTRFKTE